MANKKHSTTKSSSRKSESARESARESMHGNRATKTGSSSTSKSSK